jgi:Spy/CpxP family protein refolding chaperone
MIRKLFIATLLLCAIAVAQPPQGSAGTPGDRGFGGPGHKFGPKSGDERHPLLPPGRWWKDAEVAKAIALNDGQIQKIEQIFQDSRMKLVDIHATLQKEEIKLEPLLEADNPDESAVLGAIDRIAAARASLEKANAQMAFGIRRVLTPEQWKQLRALRPHRDHFPQPMDGPRQHSQREAHSGHEGHHPAPPPDAPAPPPSPENGAPPPESK